MGIFKLTRLQVALAVVISGLGSAIPASAAEPAYEPDPNFSLIGNCTTIPGVDPVPDPGCIGEPPAYPAPPNGPTGQFANPRALAIDKSGNQYVLSFAAGSATEGRVDVFDDKGRFITEAAVPKAQTAAVDSKGNLYVFQNDGDVVRYEPSEYKPEAGGIKYSSSAVTISSGGFAVGSVTVDNDPAHLDQVLIARPEKITRYKSAADVDPNGVIKVFKPKDLAGSWPEAMAIDSQRRRLYVTYCVTDVTECGVLVLDADNPEIVLNTIDGSTTPANKFATTSGRLPVAVDEETGELFIADPLVQKIFRFSDTYDFVSEQVFKELTKTASVQIAVSNGQSLGPGPCSYPSPPPSPGDACNRHYLYVPVFTTSKGRLAAFRRPNQVPPLIEAVSTANIAETEAEVSATIFPGGLITSYHFELTTQASYEANEWAGATILGEGAIKADRLATEVSAFATGLAPGQTYRFRAVASNEIGPAAEDGRNEAVFTTYDDATIFQDCPNNALRVGASALLSDCRAYELVSPANTSGRPPKGVSEARSVFSSPQASPAGGAVSFKIEGGSLPSSSGIGSFEGDPYVSRRTAGGWSTKLAGANGSEATLSTPAGNSSDQNYAFWLASGEGPLVIGDAIYTAYLHYPDGHSELIGRGSQGIEPRAVGKLITENATHVVFQSVALGFNKPIQLESDAPPTGTEAVYDRTIDPVTGVEETHTVSLLPGNVTPAAGQNADYLGASKDGNGIAFEIANNVYLRVNNETTYEIGKEVEFAGVSEGGARAFYVEEGNLKAFDVASEEVIDFAATGDATPVNVAEGGSRAYFISPSVLGGANPEGVTAISPASGQGTLGAKGTGTLATAKGEGTLTAEAKEVTGVSVSEGEFQPGMQITGTGIPTGTTIASVGSGTMKLSNPATQSGSTALAAGSAKVTGVSTSQGAFQAGMKISGAGIPAGTMIEKVGPGSTLTLSKPATQSGSPALAAGSTLITDVSTNEGTFRVGMNVTANGIPNGTIITAIDETADTLTLSKEASPTDTQPLSAFAQNLYLSEEGESSFIATVTARDAEGDPESNDDGLGLWTKVVGSQPARDPSRTNPDGSVFLFQSRANVTGYPESKFPQIYRFDSDAGTLHCISCIPTDVAAIGGSALESYSADFFSPRPFSSYAFVPNLNPAGTRVFFDSTEALVSTDTDKVTDVYEWEAQGVGSCKQPEGCVYLISSGQSARDNYLYGHSTSGDDVFFTTGDKLTGWDSNEGAVSIYDAKVEGGFPEPPRPDECIGEGCQAAPQSANPGLAPPTTEPVGRSGNHQGPKSCPKGKRKVKKSGKVRCVKKKQKKHKGGKAKQRASANRGAGK